MAWGQASSDSFWPCKHLWQSHGFSWNPPCDVQRQVQYFPKGTLLEDWRCVWRDNACTMRDGKTAKGLKQIWWGCQIHPRTRDETGQNFITTWLVFIWISSSKVQLKSNSMKTTCPCREYCSGVSVVSKIIEGLQPSPDWPTVLLDMFGFDGFAAMHCLVQNSNGIKAWYFLTWEFSFWLCLAHFFQESLNAVICDELRQKVCLWNCVPHLCWSVLCHWLHFKQTLRNGPSQRVSNCWVSGLPGHAEWFEAVSEMPSSWISSVCGRRQQLDHQGGFGSVLDPESWFQWQHPENCDSPWQRVQYFTLETWWGRSGTGSRWSTRTCCQTLVPKQSQNPSWVGGWVCRTASLISNYDNWTENIWQSWSLKPSRFSIFPLILSSKKYNWQPWTDYLSPSSALPRLQLNCGNFSLTWAQSDGSLWIGATSQATVPVATELFGFGSGGFVRQSEASDTMSDASSTGRWICFSISDPNDMVILEKGRKVQEHLDGQTFWNKARHSLKRFMFVNPK